MLSGALTLSIMILPLIMRTTEEALLSVPDMYREGSFGLGAGRLRTVARIVLPTGHPRYSLRRDSGHRAHRGRNGRADVYAPARWSESPD